MKYFRDEKMEGMTVRYYSLSKIIACSLGVLFALFVPKGDKKVVGGVAAISLVLASLYALSEMVTCTFSIGFGPEDDFDEDEFDCEEHCHCHNDEF